MGIDIFVPRSRVQKPRLLYSADDDNALSASQRREGLHGGKTMLGAVKTL